jgi:hypothetical protein
MSLKAHLTIYLEGMISHDLLEPLPPFDVAEFAIRSIPIQADVPWNRISMVNYTASITLDLGESKIANLPVAYETIDSLITFLRLFKRGYVGACVVEEEYWAEGTQDRSHKLYSGSSARSPQGGMAYLLNVEDIVPLQKFADKVYKIISSGEHTTRTSPKFRFFNRGIDDMARGDYPLAIVDFVSCMESLLSQSSAELRHRLSEAVALITEREARNRKDKYVRMSRLYDLRSRIIHGSEVAANDIVNDASLAETLARDVLRFCLAYYCAGHTKKRILSDIDDVIFGPSTDFPDFAFEYFKQEYASVSRF